MTLFDAAEAGTVLHGTVRRDLRLVLGSYGSPIPTCDWGFCDNATTCARYDAHARQWLACCDTCATKPEPDGIGGRA